MMVSTRGSLTIIALVAGVLVVTFIEAAKLRKECAFESHANTEISTKLVKSDDDKALVNFSGYLDYNLNDPSAKRFVNLDLKRVKLTKEDELKVLELELDCCKIRLTLEYFKYYQKNSVKDVAVELVLPNGHTTSCSSGSKTAEGKGIFWKKDVQYYSCQKPSMLTCQTTFTDSEGFIRKIDVATIRLHSLQFEVEGKREDHQNLKFTNQPFCP